MAYYVRNAANQLVAFDDAFERRQTGDPVSSVGTPYNNAAGQDIINDYVPLSFGGTQIDANSRYHADNNQDLRLIFAKKGSVGRWDGTLKDLPSLDAYQNNGDPQNYALIEYALLSNGDIRYRNNKGTSEVIVGSWLGTVANSSNTEVKCVVVSVDEQIGGGSYGGSPSTYQSISTNPGTIVVQTGTTIGTRLMVTFDVYLRKTGDPSTEIVKRVTLDAIYNLGTI